MSPPASVAPEPHLPQDAARVLAGSFAATRATSMGQAAVQAAWFIHGYAWALASAAAGPYLHGRPLPDLRVERVVMDVDADGAMRASFADPGGCVPADGPDARRRALRDGLESHLATVLELDELRCLRATSRWRLAADAVADALLAAGDGRMPGAALIDEVQATLAPPGPLAVRIELIDGAAERLRWRISCCLAYRVDGLDYCVTCPASRRGTTAA